MESVSPINRFLKMAIDFIPSHYSGWLWLFRWSPRNWLTSMPVYPLESPGEFCQNGHNVRRLSPGPGIKHDRETPGFHQVFFFFGDKPVDLEDKQHGSAGKDCSANEPGSGRCSARRFQFSKCWRCTPWWTYKKQWKITIFTGKFHYFDGHFPLLC